MDNINLESIKIRLGNPIPAPITYSDICHMLNCEDYIEVFDLDPIGTDPDAIINEAEIQIKREVGIYDN